AIRAIKFAAVDYLLKPIDFRMLVVAVERVEKIHQTNTLLNNTKSIEVLIKNLQNTANARIAIPTALGLDFIAVKNIVRLQADSNYVIVHLQSGQKVAATKTMNDFEEILSKATFFRIHKSDIVNRTYIQKYLKKGSGSVMMYDGTAIAIARRRKDDFLRWIQR
ncbi:MAG: LytR/AlgR family response regulator transcription factor, partial [Chitinophagales bacterium]